MDIYDRNYTTYRYYEQGLFTPPASGRCPYCRHQLPNCDCGYGLMELEPRESVVGKGLKRIFSTLNRAGKKLFRVRRHYQTLLQGR